MCSDVFLILLIWHILVSTTVNWWLRNQWFKLSLLVTTVVFVLCRCVVDSENKIFWAKFKYLLPTPTYPLNIGKNEKSHLRCASKFCFSHRATYDSHILESRCHPGCLNYTTAWLSIDYTRRLFQYSGCQYPMFMPGPALVSQYKDADTTFSDFYLPVWN